MSHGHSHGHGASQHGHSHGGAAEHSHGHSSPDEPYVVVESSPEKPRVSSSDSLHSHSHSHPHVSPPHAAAAGARGRQTDLPFPSLMSTTPVKPSLSVLTSQAQSSSGPVQSSAAARHTHTHNSTTTHSHSPSQTSAHVHGSHSSSGNAPLPRRTTWQKYKAMALREPESRALLAFIVASLIYALPQLLMGCWSWSASLVAASFRVFFDVCALLASLLAMAVSTKVESFQYSYGYGRFEVLAGFTQSVFLIFVATFQIFEGFHHIYKPSEGHGSPQLWLAWTGLVLDLAGVYAFKAYAFLPSDATLIPGRYLNLHGVFLHILALAFGNASFIVATAIMQWRDVPAAHALSSFLVSTLVLWTVTPLFSRTRRILLQAVDRSTLADINKSIREVSAKDGVLECRAEHWWMQEPGHIVGSLHVRIRSNANEQEVLRFVHARLGKHVTDLTCQVEKDPNWMLEP